MSIFLAEFIGTILFILLTNVCIMQTKLSKENGLLSKMFVALGFASSWMLSSFIFGTTSGGHFSPAISIAFALTGFLQKSLLIGYVVMQILGAFIGCAIFSGVYKNQLDTIVKDDDVIECFTNYPKEDLIHYGIKELLIAFVLVFSIKGVGMVWAMPSGLNYFILFIIVLCLGLSIGDFTSYAVNPLRDLPCKVILLFYGLKRPEILRKIKWHYSIVGLIAIIVGALIAVYVFRAIPWPVID